MNICKLPGIHGHLDSRISTVTMLDSQGERCGMVSMITCGDYFNCSSGSPLPNLTVTLDTRSGTMRLADAYMWAEIVSAMLVNATVVE